MFSLSSFLHFSLPKPTKLFKRQIFAVLGDLLNHQETERAGFLGQSDILRQKEPLFPSAGALSMTNGTRPYKSIH